jgi:DNA repair exonuclease SbcCD ATPase subunit
MAAAQKSPSNSESQSLKPGQIPVSTTGLPAAEGVSVDKIRDLLFGNQMQDYDRRFTALEERLLQKLNDLESESARNLSALESTLKKQLESLGNQFREEKDRRSEADKELQRSLRETTQALEKRLGALSDQHSQLERDFADQTGQQAQSLREEIKRKNEDMRAAMDKMFGELSNVKTDRNLLAGLFVEIAKCLNQDLVPKGAQGGNGDHIRPR